MAVPTFLQGKQTPSITFLAEGGNRFKVLRHGKACFTGGDDEVLAYLRKLPYESYYPYLNEHTRTFFELAGVPWEPNCGIVVCHGDKGGSYKMSWEMAGIPFHRGMLLYLLSYCQPYSAETRETVEGWKPVNDWVIQVYPKMLPMIEEAEAKVKATPPSKG